MIKLNKRKLYLVGIHWTVEKQAKRMPDTTVETTPARPIDNSAIKKKHFEAFSAPEMMRFNLGA